MFEFRCEANSTTSCFDLYFEKRQKVSRWMLINDLILQVAQQGDTKISLVIDAVEDAYADVRDKIRPIEYRPETLFRPVHHHLSNGTERLITRFAWRTSLLHERWWSQTCEKRQRRLASLVQRSTQRSDPCQRRQDADRGCSFQCWWTAEKMITESNRSEVLSDRWFTVLKRRACQRKPAGNRRAKVLNHRHVRTSSHPIRRKMVVANQSKPG